MSELEMMLAVLDRMAEDRTIEFRRDDFEANDVGAVTDIVVQNSRPVEGTLFGYSGFYTVWSFDAAGRCVGIGSYE